MIYKIIILIIGLIILALIINSSRYIKSQEELTFYVFIFIFFLLFTIFSLMSLFI